MSYRWQYPGHAEPVLPTARVETITSDMWTPQVPDPIRPARALTTAILAGAMFFVPLVSEAATLDQWNPGMAEPARAAVRTAGSESFAPTLAIAEYITVDRWQRQVSEPVRIPPSPVDVGLTEIDPTALNIDASFRADRWHPALSEPVRVPPRAVDTGITEIDPTALNLPEPTQLDKWYQPLPEPRRDRPRCQWLYPYFGADSQLHEIPVIVVPSVPGLEYTAPTNRMHFTAPENLAHYTPPTNRMHYTAPDED